MFEVEEHDNSPSIQWIRENLLTVNISLNKNGADFWPLFDSVVRDLKNRMNDRDIYIGKRLAGIL